MAGIFAQASAAPNEQDLLKALYRSLWLPATPQTDALLPPLAPDAASLLLRARHTLHSGGRRQLGHDLRTSGGDRDVPGACKQASDAP